MPSSTKSYYRMVFMPRWVFWLSVAFLILVGIAYAAAFPERLKAIQLSQVSELQGAILIGSEYAIVLLSAAFSIFVLLRRPFDRLVVLTSLSILLNLPNLTGLIFYSRPVHPVFEWITAAVMILAATVVYLLLLSMPDGRMMQSRLRYGVILSLLWDIGRYYFFFGIGDERFHSYRPLALLGSIITILPALYGTVRRYRHDATVIQRQQFKWFFMAVYVGMTGAAIVALIRIIAQAYGNPDIVLWVSFISSVFMVLVVGFVITAILFAILRWGLWDIDLTINRGLVLGIISIFLLLCFGVVFWLSQALLRLVAGETGGEFAVAIAALFVGMIFNPVRMRVRNFVDRRVFGLRFDLNELERAQHLSEIKMQGHLTGRVLGGYELLGVLGRGGMGEVYKGFADGKLVAIKILQNIDNQERFKRESELGLNHPNIVQTLDYGVDNGIHYLVLEFVEGDTLKSLLQERGKLAISSVFPYLENIAEAVDTAHRLGYVHRDIKPSNIMLRQREDGQREAILMDFGLVKLGTEASSLTGSMAIGTIDYMAPEQIMNASEIDYRADIYAFGVVLYEILAGKLPFSGTAGQVLFGHLQQPAPELADVPTNVAKAIQRALAKDPNERFQSAAEFVESLRSIA